MAYTDQRNGIDNSKKTNMLYQHFKNIENELLSKNMKPRIFGHPVNMGTAREVFVKDFLASSFPSLSYGTGEIISSDSFVGDGVRHQHDVVIFDNKIPKLNICENMDAFFVESVLATVEVKSTLNKNGLRDAIARALKIKQLNNHKFFAKNGFLLQAKILNFVVAFESQVRKVETVHNWLCDIHNELKINFTDLDPHPIKRCLEPSPSIDGIFILGQGFLMFDNSPFSIGKQEKRINHRDIKWVGANTTDKSLFVFYMSMLQVLSNELSCIVDLDKYVKNFKIPEVVKYYK